MVLQKALEAVYHWLAAWRQQSVIAYCSETYQGIERGVAEERRSIDDSPGLPKMAPSRAFRRVSTKNRSRRTPPPCAEAAILQPGVRDGMWR